MLPPGRQTLGNLAEFATLADVARLVRLSRRTVREHLLRDGIPAYVFGEKRNSTVRYRKRDVDQWLERCRLRQKILEPPGPVPLNKSPPDVLGSE